MQSPILTIEHISKRFGTKQVLEDVSLSVARGSVAGIIGPNGAGKTTLLRIINSILVKDSGSISFSDMPLTKDVSRKFGYLPEERGLYDKLSVEEQILYFGQLRGGDGKRLQEMTSHYLHFFNLEKDKKRKVGELSKGNQQKVQIISTLVHEPELVILDEPFSGFDPINGALLRKLIDMLQSENVTVILSSHNMNAIEEMCDDVTILNNGRMLLSGNLADIKDAFRGNDIIVTVETRLDIDSLLSMEFISAIRQLPSSHGRRGYAYRISKAEGVDNFRILSEVAAQAPLRHFEEALPSLSEIFINSTNSDFINEI